LVNVVEVTFSVTAMVDSQFPPNKHADDIISIARHILSPAEVKVLGVRTADEPKQLRPERAGAFSAQ
jgi:hypothetical protein